MKIWNNKLLEKYYFKKCILYHVYFYFKLLWIILLWHHYNWSFTSTQLAECKLYECWSSMLTEYPTGILLADYQNFSKLFPRRLITCHFCYLMINNIWKQKRYLKKFELSYYMKGDKKFHKRILQLFLCFSIMNVFSIKWSVVTALCTAYYFVRLYQMHSAFHSFLLFLNSLLVSFGIWYISSNCLKTLVNYEVLHHVKENLS